MGLFEWASHALAASSFGKETWLGVGVALGFGLGRGFGPGFRFGPGFGFGSGCGCGCGGTSAALEAGEPPAPPQLFGSCLASQAS